jgi:hypothetical protein
VCGLFFCQSHYVPNVSAYNLFLLEYMFSIEPDLASSRYNYLLLVRNSDAPEQKPLFSLLHYFFPLLDSVSKMRSISPNNLALVTGLFFGFSSLSTITALNITVLQPGVPFVPEKTLPLPPCRIRVR